MDQVEKAWMYLRKSKYNDIMEAEDLKEVLYLCGKDPTDKQVKSIMKSEGGLISYDRLAEIASEVQTINKSDILKAFKTFDANGDNFLSLRELKILLQKLGDKMSSTEIDKIFLSLDTNKDGKLDYEEFAGLYSNTTRQLNHLISVRVSEPDTKRYSQHSLASTVTETETETETDSEDVVVPTKQPARTPVRKPDDKSPASVKSTLKTKDSLKAKDSSKTKESLLKRGESIKESLPKTKSGSKLESEDVTEPKPTSDVPKSEPKKTLLAKGKEKAVLKSTNKSIDKAATKSTKGDTADKEAGSYHQNVRGCTYAGERGDWTAHQYKLIVKEKTKLSMLLSPLAQTMEDISQADLTLYLVKKEDNTIIHLSRQYSPDNRALLEADLVPGEYTLLTHTTSSAFVNEPGLPVTPVPVKIEGKLSTAAAKVLNDIFHCLDLNGDMKLSRSEFELFHITSTGETLNDSMWAVIQDNFQLAGQCLTLEGFMALHEMALGDEDGGEEEIRETLNSMGYNEALQLVKAVPWHVDVHSNKEVQLKVESLVALTSNQLLERSVVLGIEKEGNVQESDKYKLYTQTLPWKSTAAIHNLTDKALRMEVNTSGSENCLENPPYKKHILTVAAHRTVICHHFSPELRSKKFKPIIKVRCVGPSKTKLKVEQL